MGGVVVVQIECRATIESAVPSFAAVVVAVVVAERAVYRRSRRSWPPVSGTLYHKSYSIYSHHPKARFSLESVAAVVAVVPARLEVVEAVSALAVEGVVVVQIECRLMIESVVPSFAAAVVPARGAVEVVSSVAA